MSEDSPARVNRRGGVYEVILDRGKANAITRKGSFALNDIWRTFRDDERARVGILTGAGEKFFSAGWDLKSVEEDDTTDTDWGPWGFGGLNHPRNLYKPIIAAVNGYAVGGGMEMMLGCDIIVAEEHAIFALPEINVGVLPDCGAIKLRRRIPYHVAVEFMMTGRQMDAEEAKHWGLVNHVVPRGEALAKAREIADRLAAGPPLLYPAIKQVLKLTEMVTENEAFTLHDASSAVAAINQSEDLKEGARAFAEKRDPVWKGR